LRLATSCYLVRCALLATTLLGCARGFSEDLPIERNSLSDHAAGQRLYLDGIRPSGEPLAALVTGDVPFLGTQFGCQNCHGRSGMGTSEGSIIVPAIAGPVLYSSKPQPQRPAYTDESLARALRDGIDPAGRPLNRLMPRYQLTDAEIAVLSRYLRGLSAGPSPGADDRVIRFATVVTPDIDPDLRDAVHAVLRTFVDEKNRQTRLERQRPDRGSTPATRLPTLYRDWALDIWALRGPAETWQAQLEHYYQQQPVFALLSGLGNDTWRPISQFCEAHAIPCLYPSTNVPAATPSDFYSRYFSAGLTLEADLIASHLQTDPVAAVIQVYCESGPARVAANLASSLDQQSIRVETVSFDCRESFPIDQLNGRLVEHSGAAIILWLSADHLHNLELTSQPARVYLSSTLSGDDHTADVNGSAAPTFLAHAFRLPGKFDPAFRRFEAWARTRSIAVNHPRQQAEAFYTCLVANDLISHLDRFLVRDYLLDMLDHTDSMIVFLPFYPRATLGPGQHFLTKGGYLLPIHDGLADTTAAVWIRP